MPLQNADLSDKAPHMREQIRGRLSGLDLEDDESGSEHDSDDEDDDSASGKVSRGSGPTKPKKAVSYSDKASTNTPKPKPKTRPTPRPKSFGPLSAGHNKPQRRDPLSPTPDFDAEPGDEIRWWIWNKNVPGLPAGYRFWETIHADVWTLTVSSQSVVVSLSLITF